MQLLDRIRLLLQRRRGGGPAGGIVLKEGMRLPSACARVVHMRNGKVLGDETVWNVITNSGRDFLHQQGYQTTGLGTNGLNYIALSDDAVTETATSTTLSNEIVANGLSRVQGVVAHTAGTNTTTVTKTFTCNTAQQKCQKAALFTASSAGTMCHVLGFTERTLQIGDQIQIAYTITLG